MQSCPILILSLTAELGPRKHVSSIEVFAPINAFDDTKQLLPIKQSFSIIHPE